MQNQRKRELTFYTQLAFVLIKLSRLLKVNCLKEAEISSDYFYIVVEGTPSENRTSSIGIMIIICTAPPYASLNTRNAKIFADNFPNVFPKLFRSAFFGNFGELKRKLWVLLQGLGNC